MSTDNLTTTSYAVLGLLSLRSWTTYELAQQMQRSLRHFWPRAESRIYEEPKRLAAQGLVTATRADVGRRRRTVYEITPAGREALEAWLARPGGGLVLEFEALLKVFYGDQATKDDVLTNIAAAADWARRQNDENVAFARLYHETGGSFPDRLPVIVLTGRFMTDLADLVARWCEWAEQTVAAWPEDPKQAEPDRAVLEEIARRELRDDRPRDGPAT